MRRAAAFVRDYRQVVAIGVAVLAAMLLLSALEPSPAKAWLLELPSPGQVFSGLLGSVGNVIGGTVGKLALTAFDAIIHALFAPIAQFINTQLIGWLVAVPDYAPPGSHVAATVFWNGPRGRFELTGFAAGTRAIAEAVASTSAMTVVAGEHIVKAFRSSGLQDRVSYVSTGGEATVELFEDRRLPGIQALLRAPVVDGVNVSARREPGPVTWIG